MTREARKLLARLGRKYGAFVNTEEFAQIAGASRRHIETAVGHKAPGLPKHRRTGPPRSPKAVFRLRDIAAFLAGGEL